MDDLALFFLTDPQPMRTPVGERRQAASKRMPTQVRQADPDSSWTAAMSLHPSAVALLERTILEVLRAHGPIVGEQVAKRVQELHPARWDEGTIRTRLRPMERKGLVKATGEQGQTSRGKPAQKWAVV